MTSNVQTILQRAARRCSYDPATIDFFGGNDPAGAELIAYLADVAAEITDRVDAAPLSASFRLAKDYAGQITGTATFSTGLRLPIVCHTDARGFTLPEWVLRIARDPRAFYEDTYRQPRILVQNGGDWAARVAWGPTGADRYFATQGLPGAIRVACLPMPELFLPFTLTAATDLWVRSASDGRLLSEPVTGDDIPVIPERLLEDGVVMRFRERRGLDWESVLDRFEARLARWDNDTKARQSVSLARPSALLDRDGHPILPQVPDYIPPAPGA